MLNCKVLLMLRGGEKPFSQLWGPNPDLEEKTSKPLGGVYRADTYQGGSSSGRLARVFGVLLPALARLRPPRARSRVFCAATTLCRVSPSRSCSHSSVRGLS